jgi:hypothetical protein
VQHQGQALEEPGVVPIHGGREVSTVHAIGSLRCRPLTTYNTREMEILGPMLTPRTLTADASGDTIDS